MTRKLLVTDDAPIIRAIIKDAASEDGWTVVGEAINGQDAIDKYIEFEPDAVTLDLVMPGTDGIHALRGIREHDPDACVLVVSALEQSTILKEAFKLGATDFICKPFDRDVLLKALSALVPVEV